ncbi:MAG: host-nuclease inhibitor Gam family protein [Ignavibacteriaceae bacterium]|nr:host-nuclease inhibitor Gam family protein [Ignavibacteriaceae bacterium]
MEDNFLNELLQEAESKEMYQTEAYYDLVLLQIKNLQGQIASNFSEAEKEIQHINSWVLQRNMLLDERCKMLERKLESFIRERQVKTIELPNGTLKMHKKPDKIEIENLELFLKHARPEVLTIIPEQVKPDLSKLKAFIKTRPVPAGIKIIEGSVEFTYKIRLEVENVGSEETGFEAKRPNGLRAVI